MAILKHIASKSSNYGAALEYLIFKHDELRKTPILDQKGNRIMRDEFYLDGLNCEPYSFDAACQQLNREYQKNKNKNEIKSHHYIISFDPRDSTENCLTGKRAQELGLEYAKANFPGHQALVCTHMDGHNGSGNIHVHIVIKEKLTQEIAERKKAYAPLREESKRLEIASDNVYSIFRKTNEMKSDLAWKREWETKVREKARQEQARQEQCERQVPIWEKSNLTLEEAAAYSGIGINKLREMSDSKDCTFVLWNGTKRLLKRRRLDEHLDRLFSI